MNPKTKTAAMALLLLLASTGVNGQANPNPNTADDCHGPMCKKEAIIGGVAILAIGILIMCLAKYSDKVNCCGLFSKNTTTDNTNNLGHVARLIDSRGNSPRDNASDTSMARFANDTDHAETPSAVVAGN